MKEPSGARSQIAHVRRFNRTVTERIGVLDDHFLGRTRPLGEARLLWEIADGADLCELRARLALDSGYLSRLTASLEAQRLIRIEVSPRDRRVRRARLTPTGRTERARLDRLSDRRATALLDRLTSSQRARLVTAMDEVERLLAASMVVIAAEPADGDDASACLRRYFAELARRFDAGFTSARSLPADAASMTPPAGVFLIARLRGEPIGCGALKLHGDAPAELKRMWIAPSARGLGLGRRMLAELETHARAGGARVIRLETNRALREAIQLYRAAGYREVAAFNDEAYAHHWFEKRLARARPRDRGRRLCSEPWQPPRRSRPSGRATSTR